MSDASASPHLAEQRRVVSDADETKIDRALAGRRIRLIACTDSYAKMKAGRLGTIDFLDALGTLQVRWDDGPRFGLIAAAGDEWELLE